MAVASRNTSQALTATHYNEIRNLAVSILGTGSGNYGYGQPTVSSTRAAGTNLVSAIDMQNLRTDIMRSWVHQTGSNTGLEVPVAGTDTIRAGSTTTMGAIMDPEYDKTHNAYIEAVNQIESNRLVAHPGQMTLLPATATKSNSNWGQGTVTGGSHTMTISHTVTFSSENHRRWFFNAGGQIRIYAWHTHSGTFTAKDEDWLQFLSNKVNNQNYITHTEFSALSGTSYSTFHQVNAGDHNSAYSDNYWNVQVRLNGSNLDIQQNYVDADVGWVNRFWVAAYDEPVTGTTSSNLGIYYPTGSTTDAIVGSTPTVQLAPPTIA